MELLYSGWDFAKGFVGPMTGAGLAFAAAAYAWLRIPFFGREVAAALVLAGGYLLGYANAYSQAREDARSVALRAQAAALKESITGLQTTIGVVNGLQESMVAQATMAAARDAEQRGKTDDLLAKLLAGPVAAGCSWSGSELDGVRAIRIGPAAAGSTGAASGQPRGNGVR